MFSWRSWETVLTLQHAEKPLRSGIGSTRQKILCLLCFPEDSFTDACLLVHGDDLKEGNLFAQELALPCQIVGGEETSEISRIPHQDA